MPGPEHDLDLVVVGGGPGGYVAAIRAAQLKLKTALVEKDKLGGICLNWGCIPTKALLKNAEVYHQFQRAKEWGISFENLRFDFARIIKRSRDVAGRLNKGVEFLMKKNGIVHVSGTARLADPRTVVVASTDGKETRLSTKRVCLATGARPRALPGVAFDKERIVSYVEAMVLSGVPRRFLMIGGGPIGLEFAYFYNTFGSKVTVIEMMPQILPQEDAEVAAELHKALSAQGITILTGAKVRSAEVSAGGVELEVAQGDSVLRLAGDVTLLAAGVQGNVENLGLEALGVALEKGFVKVDGSYRTSVAGIWAIGDVIGPPMLAHVASAEGVRAAESMAGLPAQPLDYTTIPACTYTQPQVASVGLTEAKARELGPVKVGRFPFRSLGKAVAIGERDGFVKLVFDARYGELLGAHIIGSEATEMIAEVGLGRALETTGLELHRTVHAHPTLAEAVMEAAGDASGECIHQ
jgi:dihydrolipoamide dehydrogenase